MNASERLEELVEIAYKSVRRPKGLTAKMELKPLRRSTRHLTRVVHSGSPSPDPKQKVPYSVQLYMDDLVIHE